MNIHISNVYKNILNINVMATNKVAKLIISHFDIDKSHINIMMFYIACFMSHTALVSKFNHKKLKFLKKYW